MAGKADAEQAERFQFLARADLTKHYRVLHELAVGVYYEGCSQCSRPVESCQCGKPAGVRVYKARPDRQALMFLTEQGIGKATQKSDVVRDTEIVITHSVPRPGRAVAQMLGLEPEERVPVEGEEDDADA